MTACSWERELLRKKEKTDFQGISVSANGAENKINTIEIPHQRTRTPSEILTGAELSIFRSEIAKLTRVAKMARPDLMYDVSEAAQMFSKREIIDVGSKK